MIIPAGYAYESFGLDEGQVYVMCPQRLSPESYGDLRERLELFLRMMQRCVVQPEPPPAPPASPPS